MEPVLRFMTMCENIETTMDGKMKLVAPLISFRLPYIPGLFSFAVAAGLDNFDDNMHMIKFVLKNCDNDEIIINTNDMPFQMGPKPNEDSVAEVLLSVDFKNVEFLNKGLYKMEVFVDGQSLGGQEITASQIKKEVK